MASNRIPIFQQEALNSKTIQEFIHHGMTLTGESFGFSSANKYVYYSPQWIGLMAEKAIHIYKDQGVQVRSSADGFPITAFRVSSSIESVITFLALVRLGHVVLLVSPDMAVDDTEALATELHFDLMINGLGGCTYKSIPMVTLEQLSQFHCLANTDKQATSFVVPDENEPALMVHSSGTTGRPKVIAKTHFQLLRILRGLSSVLHNKDLFVGPWMHWVIGAYAVLFALVRCGSRTCWAGDGRTSADAIKQVLLETKPQVMWCHTRFLVPASESPEGLECLKRCMLVVNLGGLLPPYVSSRLIKEGVRLATAYGMSELPMGLTSEACAGDPLYWDYVQPDPVTAQHLYFRPLAEDEAIVGGRQLFELVVLPTLPSLEKRWANAPDGSVHTGDIFMKHPTKDHYRCLGRMRDDIKLRPGGTGSATIRTRSYEDVLERRHQELIDAAVFFGDKQIKPGILLFVKSSMDASQDEVVEAAWKTIQHEMQELIGLGLTKNMVVVVLDTVVPRTSKGEVVRAEALLQSNSAIWTAYRATEES
ncbi:putative Acetyl-CoA synthetase-like protein [Seiridium cardinale]